MKAFLALTTAPVLVMGANQPLMELDARDPSAETQTWASRVGSVRFAKLGDVRAISLNGVRAVLFNDRTDAYIGPAAPEVITGGVGASHKGEAFAGDYEFTGEPEYRDAACNFWRYVVQERSCANGSNSDHEKFTPKAHLSLSLSAGNAETCNTHNMLKLSRHLFAWQPSAAVADYYERAQLNHILSSQHPKRGTVAYFHGMQSGSRKGFSPGWVSLACCHGSGMENHAKYADSIYFHHGGERLFVNLFIASEVNWQDAGLVVRQTTKFPEEAGTTLEIVSVKDAKATISIRKAAWVTGGFAVQLNGESGPTTAGPEGFVDLTRVWKAGDKISVALPMALHWEGFRDNPDRAALLCGPVMLVAKTDLGARYSVARKPAGKALAALKPAAKPLHFSGDPAVFQRDFAPKPPTFLPLCQEYEDAYIAYWDLRDDRQRAAERADYDAEAKRWKELAPRTVDRVSFEAGTPSAPSTMPGRMASDPDARRATNCGVEVQVAGVQSSTAGNTPDKAEATPQGNQLDTGAKARTLPPLTLPGTIGPAKADGTFRDLTFKIPANRIADKHRLMVRLVRQGGKIGGLVAEVRSLRD